MVAIFTHKVMAEEGKIVQKRAEGEGVSGRTGSVDISPGIECNMRDGGGRRIRTFEVCDGRFTVCSLWPLGNPTWDS